MDDYHCDDVDIPKSLLALIGNNDKDCDKGSDDVDIPDLYCHQLKPFEIWCQRYIGDELHNGGFSKSVEWHSQFSSCGHFASYIRRRTFLILLPPDNIRHLTSYI